MKCPDCGTTNRKKALFCRQCGHRLTSFCPACGARLRHPATFCDQCGHALGGALPATGSAHSHPPVDAPQPGLSSPVQTAGRQLPTPDTERSASNPFEQFIPQALAMKLEAARTSGSMAGERRVVTMLFCDVKGSTAAAEQLDPEEWTEIINGAFEHMIKPVYMYEGTVARLMGDAILAFFGAPITHEDDPRRAVLAGLDIVAGIAPYRESVKDKWGIDINVRVGINTGMVVVGAVGSDLRMEYTAMGDAINLAARMEQSATPGTVQIAHETYKLVKPLFDFEELGGIEVKGKAEPVPAYQVLNRKTAAGRLRGIEGLAIKLIGRDEELASLEAVMKDVRQGVGRIVCIVGEAGLGKSRLVREVRARQDGDSQSPTWYETASLSYETAQPYALFQRLIRRATSIVHNDPPVAVREKLTPLADTFPEEQQAQVSVMLGTLFGLDGTEGQPPLEGEAFRRALFELMPGLWRQFFGNRPSVVVFEDIHWSDPASIALLQQLLPLAEAVPLVFLCVLRSERQAPGWQIRTTADETYRHRYTEISLRPLSNEQSNQMIDSLLGNPEMPTALRNRILERASGNPFFIEEVVRALIDSGTILPEDGSDGRPRWRVDDRSSDIHIPGNLQALLTARIDSLDEEVRQTLQLASVIGRNFYQRVLTLISEANVELNAHIHTLLRQEMIRESARLPEVEYSFRNPLTQEAAYRTILLKHRREFHRRVGEAMEMLFASQLNEFAPRLGHHFAEAGHDEKAVKYYLIAGNAAARLYANVEAVEHYTQALKYIEHGSLSSEESVELYTRRGRALELLGRHEDAVANYQALQALGHERGDGRMELAAMTAQATIRSIPSPVFDEALGRRLSEEAILLANELGENSTAAKIHWNLMLHYMWGKYDFKKGAEHGEASLAIAREFGLVEQLPFTLNDLAAAYTGIGELKKALPFALEARELFRSAGDLPMLANNLITLGGYHLLIGDFPEVLAYSDEAYQINEPIDNLWGLSGSYFLNVFVLLEYGEFGKADEAIETLLRLVVQVNLKDALLAAAVLRATVHLHTGEADKGVALLEEMMGNIEEYAPLYKAWFWAAMSRLHVAQGALESAQGSLEKSLSFFDEGHPLIPVYSPLYVRLAACEVRLAADDAAGAIVAADELLDATEKVGVRLYLPDIRYVKSRALRRLGRLEEARETLSRAENDAETMGGRRILWQILAAQAELNEDPVAADRQRGEAQEIVAFIVKNAGSNDHRSSFLGRPEVQKLMKDVVP